MNEADDVEAVVLERRLELWADVMTEVLEVSVRHQRAVDRVITLVDGAEYKRRQYPPGPKITVRNFGRDRRLPITNRWRESTASPASTQP